ncbi:hypothetical protein ACIODW_00185 [Streptomyces sp. NPDC087897]|uniref:hypothetical protein n=1 Tax=Streptomyces sp. NPDC087897 TaxID=3365817 RepID=UPI003819F310
MRPEDTDGTGENGLRVPMARLTTEYIADELLAADLDAIGPAPQEAEGDREARMWTPAWQVGLPLGHLAVHLC